MQNGNSISKGLRRSDPDRPRPLADAVLRLIWDKKRISRAEIAREAGLSRSTVSEIVGEILPMGLVAEVGEGPSRGGRRPIVLEFQDDVCTILGVEIFAMLHRQETINNDTNFENFSLSFTSLLRVSTGEGWNFVMDDMLRKV